MASAMFINSRGSNAGTLELSPSNGRMAINYGHAVERQLLPTDPLGTVTISLSGIKPGSEVVVFDKNGTPVATVASSGTSASFMLSRYADGSPNNKMRFMVLALSYEVVDFDYTLTSTNATIPIFQRIDRSYRNPA
jgi:hypothetical protein